MRLTTKILLYLLAIFILSVSITALISYIQLDQAIRQDITLRYESTFTTLDGVLNQFFDDIAQDLNALSVDARVQYQDHTHFTSFLSADPLTFKYDYTPQEQAIIDLFYAYMSTHAHVNAVYMGRENGSFVRSHPRSSPTAYDPRQRPWYQAAIASPNLVVLTEPYTSVTNSDINIGSVKTLLNATGKRFGVIGIDVTLMQLYGLMHTLPLAYEGTLYMVAKDDVILYAPEPTLQFKAYSEILSQTPVLQT